jgi:hypothetical protein
VIVEAPAILQEDEQHVDEPRKRAYGRQENHELDYQLPQHDDLRKRSLLAISKVDDADPNQALTDGLAFLGEQVTV